VKSNFFRFWFPAILYSGIIFYASSIAYIQTPLPDTVFDKILHLLEYMPFGFLTARAIYHIGVPISGRRLGLLVLAISCLYGASDEIHQSFVPGRSTDGIDLIADAMGGVIGAYLYWLFLKGNNH